MLRRLTAFILVAALLLSGCTPGSTTPTSSSPPNVQKENQLLQTMTQQAQAYESVYALWNYDALHLSDAVTLAGNWLLLNHSKQLDSYRAPDAGPVTYQVPQNQLVEVWELLTGQSALDYTDGQPPSQDPERFSGLVDMSIALELMDSQIDYDATGQATRATLDFARYQATEGGPQWIYPARYTLVPYTIETVPQLLASVYQSGDQLWRVEQYETVTNLDQLQAHDPTVVTTLLHYSIRTPEDLVEMSRRINTRQFQEVQASYRLENDLDMTGISWIPAGIGPIFAMDKRSPRAPGFCGSFDGQGYTIRNLTVDDLQLQEQGYYPNNFGFFALLAPSAKVENLKIENANLSLQESIEAGGLVAGAAYGTIRNCQVTGKVAGFGPLGGLVGRTENAQLVDCTAQVQLFGSMEVGGLVGSASDTRLESCSVAGQLAFVPIKDSVLTQPVAMGGLVGHYGILLDTPPPIVNCHADTTLDFPGTTPTLLGAYIGQAVGEVVFENCSYTAPSGLAPLGEQELNTNPSTQGLTLAASPK